MAKKKSKKKQQQQMMLLAAILVILSGAIVYTLFFHSSSSQSTGAGLSFEQLDALIANGDLETARSMIEPIAFSDLPEHLQAKFAGYQAKLLIPPVQEKIRQLYTAGDFRAARLKCDEAGRRFGYRTHVNLFTEIGIAVQLVQSMITVFQSCQAAAASSDLDHLIMHRDQLQNGLLLKFEENEKFLDHVRSLPIQIEGIGNIDSVNNRARDLLVQLNKRIEALQNAHELWQYASQHRKMGVFREEVKALRDMADYPGDILEAVTGTPRIDTMLRAGETMVSANRLYASKKYEKALEVLRRVPRSDPHWEFSEELRIKIENVVGYSRGLRLYKEGQGEEALKELAKVQTNRARLLASRVRTAVEKHKVLLGLQKQADWNHLIPAALDLLQTLDPRVDTWYHRRTNELVEFAIRKKLELEFAAIVGQYQKRQFKQAYLALNRYLAASTLNKAPDLEKKGEELKATITKVLVDSAAQPLQQAESGWQVYKQATISEEECSGPLNASFQSKAQGLTKLYELIRFTDDAYDVLPTSVPEKRRFEQIQHEFREEVLALLEVLASVRRTYASLGSKENVSAAEEKTLLLPELKNTGYHKDIRELRKQKTQ